MAGRHRLAIPGILVGFAFTGLGGGFGVSFARAEQVIAPTPEDPGAALLAPLTAGAPDWLRLTPAPGPGARWHHAMAYDSARGRVVLFGGASLSTDFLDDTWEWDGNTWARRAPTSSPSARSQHAMAYDSARGRVMLFGGYNGSQVLNDTWEWDGKEWVERTLGPFGLVGHAMAYDSARGRVVLFGGRSASAPLAETWEWDGSTWTERSPVTSPPARAYHAMAYDSSHGRVVLFGGAGSSGLLADTWEWDGSTWIERTPVTGPSAREDHAMAYDSARGRVVLFGGSAGGLDMLGDTWEWDGSAWIEHALATRPPALRFHAMAYDGVRGRVLLVGGYGAGFYGAADAWHWDGSSWDRIPEASPRLRHGHATAYDGARGRVVLFGGMTAAPPYPASNLADTWEWDGSTWIEQVASTSPPARQGHAMAYDSARGRIVLFGGSTGGSGALGDTWEWDGSTWTERTPGSSPPSRHSAAMAYDSSRGRVVLFGGYDDSGFLGDTWEWDGTFWYERVTPVSPSARAYFDMAYDSTRFRVVLFGGYGDADGDGEPDPGETHRDTWEWDGNRWLGYDAPGAPRPTAVVGHAMSYDIARGRVVLFGGFQDLNDDGEPDWDSRDTWEWEGSQWVQQVTATRPATADYGERVDYAMAYDSARGRVVLFGGDRGPNTTPNYLADTWEYGHIEGCGHAVSVVSFAPGDDTDDTSAIEALGPPDDRVVSLGLDGSLVLALDPPLRSAPVATDLIVHEAGHTDGGIDERYRVEASEDGVEFVLVLGACAGDDCQLDLAATGLTSVQYIRLTDLGCCYEPPGGSGADIDAVSVLQCGIVETCNGVDDDIDGLVDEDWLGEDTDADGVHNVCDNCRTQANSSQLDGEGDGVGDACDNCPADANPSQVDSDLDGTGDACDPCPLAAPDDVDADGVCGNVDNCPTVPNPNQDDGDTDGLGDVCDGCPADALNDVDGDAVCGDVDNCPATPNGGQADRDGDGAGDACDPCVTAPGASDGDGELFHDWAASAVASSEYSSGDWSALQAVGPPESAGICEDAPTAWAPLEGTPDPEWLELSYPALPVKSIGVDVHESFEGRFVRQIELRDTTGMYHAVWRGIDGTACGGVLEARWPMTDFTVDRVVVHTAAPGWEEVDAVELLAVYDVADGIGDACDNCPEYPNAMQADFDGDGAGDACDCDPVDPSVRPPEAVDGLVVESLGAGALRLTWEPAAGSASYGIVRGELSALSATHMGDCQVSGWTTLEWNDWDLPAADDGFAYLVRGESPACGPGTLGFGAYGVARINTGSACPE